MTQYAIIGSGNVGSALARLFARAGVGASIANTRGPESIAAPPGVRPVPLPEALESEVLLLAIPFPAVAGFGAARPDWTGTTVVDTTNAYYTPDSADILQGRRSTAYVADRLPGAEVVKAFNQLPAATLAAELDPAVGKRVVFLATDSPAAGDRVADLVGRLGLAAVQLGRIDGGGVLIEAPHALVLRNFVERPLTGASA